MYIQSPKWAEDLFYAVEQAIDSGVNPAQFRREVADCWEEVLRRKLSEEPKQFYQS
jgi:hypothetical protein